MSQPVIYSRNRRRVHDCYNPLVHVCVYRGPCSDVRAEQKILDTSWWIVDLRYALRRLMHAWFLHACPVMDDWPRVLDDGMFVLLGSWMHVLVIEAYSLDGSQIRRLFLNLIALYVSSTLCSCFHTLFLKTLGEQYIEW